MALDFVVPMIPPEPPRRYVTYFDEVKAMPGNGQDFYLVGGIAVPMEEIGGVENEISALADDIFGNQELTPQTEFHASHIYFGKGPFKGMEPAKRISIIERLASILASSTGVRRIYAAINTRKLIAPERAAEFAFAHFCERVQLMTTPRSTSILIGDLEDQQVTSMVRDFARFRVSGTPWHYGVEVKNIVDSVHFAKSHHSRLIQLADIYVFLVSHKFGTRKGFMSDLLRDALKEKDLCPHRYKEWPRS